MSAMRGRSGRRGRGRVKGESRMANDGEGVKEGERVKGGRGIANILDDSDSHDATQDMVAESQVYLLFSLIVNLREVTPALAGRDATDGRFYPGSVPWARSRSTLSA